MVRPPSSRAPRAASAITPPSPPQMSAAPAARQPPHLVCVSRGPPIRARRPDDPHDDRPFPAPHAIPLSRGPNPEALSRIAETR